MSSEPDYNFNPPAAAVAVEEGSPLLLPVALLILAIAVIMVAQTVNIFKQHSALKDAKVQYEGALENRKAMVKQSQDLQNKLQALVLDLLILSKTDDEAKAIVQKYNIQNNAPAGAPAAAPDAAPAPAK
jgi:hypothetical protein